MGIHEPYIDSRRLAELRFCESVEELVDKVCSPVFLRRVV
jgi:hypothetical protein